MGMLLFLRFDCFGGAMRWSSREVHLLFIWTERERAAPEFLSREFVMIDEPINHTVVWAGCVIDGKWEKTEHVTYYKDVLNYDSLPEVAKCEETKAEYEAWWEWYRKRQVMG